MKSFGASDPKGGVAGPTYYAPDIPCRTGAGLRRAPLFK